MTARYIVGDTRAVLATLEPGSVDLVLSSPPYLALRSYLPAGHPDKAQEIGSEATPGAYIDILLDVVEACARVLAPHGTMLFELGDTYSGAGGENHLWDTYTENGQGGRRYPQNEKHPVGTGRRNITTGWPLDRSLCMIPELFRIALVYGFNPLTGRQTPRWRARNVIRHFRPNPPVGALGQKWRPATSDWVAVCGTRRWFDLDAVRVFNPRVNEAPLVQPKKAAPERFGQRESLGDPQPQNPAGAPPLDWHTDDDLEWRDGAGIVMPTAPYPGAHYACVDSDTEALTQFGWRRHDQLNDGDVIAAYDADTDRIVWQPAIFARYYVRDLDMVAVEKRHTSQLLTPNHRVPVRTRTHPKPYVRRADQLTPGCDVMLNAPWQPRPQGTGPGEKLAELIGWFLAEGWLPKAGRGRPGLAQSLTANPEKVQRIRELLGAVGCDWSEKRYNGIWRGRPYTMVTFAVRKGHVSRTLWATEKRLTPSMVFDWSDADARALLDGLVGGDGCTRDDGRMAFIQKDRAFADLFQALALRCGLTARLRPHDDGHCVQMATYNRWVTLRGTGGTHAPIPRQQYTGTVWCPSVPSSFWLARRDGKPFITGNTFSPRLVARLLDCQCPTRVCRVCGKPSERIVSDPQYVKTRDGGKPNLSNGHHGPDLVNRKQSGIGDNSVIRVASTLGWSDCGHGDWRPGLVLDPFAGSGTTLQVATGHGRDAIGVDIDARNADLAVERVGPLLLTVEHHQAEEGVVS